MKHRNLFSIGPLVLFFVFGFYQEPATNAWGLEKLRFATPTKVSPHHNLPPMAADEQGFWKEQGLDVDWAPLKGDTGMFRALAGGRIDMGITATPGPIQAAARGVPAVIVADTHLENYNWFIYVNIDSVIREGKDLKGKRLAVNIFGGTAHAYGRALVKGLNLEKDVRFVATGGVREMIAALRSRAVESVVLPLLTMARLKFQGHVREVVAVSDYLPKPWSDHIIFAGKDYIAQKPESVEKVLKGLLKATQFLQKDLDWTGKKMVSSFRYSPEVAKKMVTVVRYGQNFNINHQAIKNVRDFLKDYEIIQKSPPVNELFTDRFLP